MPLMDEVALDLIRRSLGIDLRNPAVRRRAWRRLRVFKDLIAQCEADGSHATADFLRRLCQRATRADPDPIALALLAGPERPRRKSRRISQPVVGRQIDGNLG
jgi:hypothetical protein